MSGQGSPFTAWQTVQIDVANACPNQPLYLEPELLEHSPNLPVHTLCEHDSQASRASEACVCYPRNFAIEPSPAGEVLRDLGGSGPVEGDLVFLLGLPAGVGELLRKLAVISQKKQAFARGVESSDVKHLRVLWRQEVKDRVARVRIASRADKPCWLVQG